MTDTCLKNLEKLKKCGDFLWDELSVEAIVYQLVKETDKETVQYVLDNIEESFEEVKKLRRNKMKELKNKMRIDKYTKVMCHEEIGTNAEHLYTVNSVETGEELSRIHFQNGAIKENGVNGVCNEDLIRMVIDRLEGFQGTQFKCRENAIAITKLEEALMWLNKRTTERELRNVEGTHKV